jgi:GT2 family glycosyltransferase
MHTADVNFTLLLNVHCNVSFHSLIAMHLRSHKQSVTSRSSPASNQEKKKNKRWNKKKKMRKKNKKNKKNKKKKEGEKKSDIRPLSTSDTIWLHCMDAIIASFPRRIRYKSRQRATHTSIQQVFEDVLDS